jgi:hypothetical protein
MRSEPLGSKDVMWKSKFMYHIIGKKIMFFHVSDCLVSVPSQESEQSCVSPRLWFLLFLRFIYWDLTAWYFFHLHINTKKADTHDCSLSWLGIDTKKADTHDCSLSWLGTDTKKADTHDCSLSWLGTDTKKADTHDCSLSWLGTDTNKADTHDCLQTCMLKVYLNSK